MNLKQAIKSLQPFKRKGADTWNQYFKAGTGPFNYLVDCDYFISSIDKFPYEEEEVCFNTSIDLYRDELFANDYEINVDKEKKSDSIKDARVEGQ